MSETAPRPEQPAERRGQATSELRGSGRELPARQEGEGSGRWAQPLQKRSRTFKDKELPGGTAEPGHVRNINQTRLKR